MFIILKTIFLIIRTMFRQYLKYQGVKEFHMLALIGCYCNIMVFSPF